MKLMQYLKLMRFEQYYKNAVIFLAIFFSGNILRPDYLSKIFFGFVSLCLMSSVNYIINDNLDRKNDAYNREKSSRPLASGKISASGSLILASTLFAASIAIAYSLNLYFLSMVAIFFIVSSLYSLFLKNEIFLDLIAVSINFVIRAISGAVIINVWTSPWLIIGTFFLSLLLVTGKRKSELAFLKSNAPKHRPVLRLYSPELLNNLIQISATLLLISYALYSFLGNTPIMLFTLPIPLYIVLKFLGYIDSGAEYARAPNKLFFDYKILLAIVIYFSITFAILY